MANPSSNKQQTHISIDVGLVEKVKSKGFNLSAICNTALINAVNGYIPKTKEELDALEWDLKQTKENSDELLDIHNKLLQDYDTLKATAIQKLEELKAKLSDKDTHIQQQDRQHKQDKDKALNELENRLDISYTEQIEGLQQRILDINTANKSKEDSIHKETDKINDKIIEQNKELSAKESKLEALNAKLTKKDTDYTELERNYNSIYSEKERLKYDRSLSKYAPQLVLAIIFLVIVFSGYGIYLLRIPISSGLYYLSRASSSSFNGIYTSIRNLNLFHTSNTAT